MEMKIGYVGVIFDVVDNKVKVPFVTMDVNQVEDTTRLPTPSSLEEQAIVNLNTNYINVQSDYIVSLSGRESTTLSSIYIDMSDLVNYNGVEETLTTFKERIDIDTLDLYTDTYRRDENGRIVFVPKKYTPENETQMKLSVSDDLKSGTLLGVYNNNLEYFSIL